MSKGFRPPAVPLAAVDPYFSVWSASDNLYDDYTKHWTGKRQGMTGIIKIDGRAFRFMGKAALDDMGAVKEPGAMEQINLEVKPLSTVYTFEGGNIILEAEFTTPLLMDDLHLLSRPASYITFRVRSKDNKQHDVKLYFDVTGEWCVNTPEQEIVWGRRSINESVDVLFMGTQSQEVLKKQGDDIRIDWGYIYLAAPKTYDVKTFINSYIIRQEFIEKGTVESADSVDMPAPVQDKMPVMSAVIDYDAVGPEEKSYYFVLAYDDIYSVEYFKKPLAAYWKQEGMTMDKMLLSSVEEYSTVMEKCYKFNEKLIDDGKAAGGEKYSDLLSLAYRQAIAAHKLTRDENGKVLFISKECFSNGCMATVDVSYPSIPLFLIYNPELVKGMMRPIFKYANTEDWVFDFAPHDVGCYPIANGQVYGNNELKYQMPVEECGNMLVMMTAVCLAEGNGNFAEENWSLLTKWADYLTENGLDPGNQLCTDDFAGHLAHNANLSVKAIMGIGGYSILCSILGRNEESSRYLGIAKNMASQWVKMAGEDDHYKLTFTDSGTWSMKYNMVWDSIFNLGLFDDTVKESEVRYYIKKQNKYGVPLDSRKTYTKTDWLVWSAAMAGSRVDFETIINPLWDFVNESPSRVPFTDWYETVTGKQVGFQHRSVIGGIFIKLLKDRGLTVNQM